jgi:hypothetical protein
MTDKATSDLWWKKVLGDDGSPYRPGEPVVLGRYGFGWLRLS